MARRYRQWRHRSYGSYQGDGFHPIWLVLIVLVFLMVWLLSDSPPQGVNPPSPLSLEIPSGGFGMSHEFSRFRDPKTGKCFEVPTTDIPRAFMEEYRGRKYIPCDW